MNRLELQRLFKAIAARDINMVMVSEASRLSRSIKDFSQIWEFMQAHGCGFLSLRENFDTSTAAGEMMLYSIANFAQFERRQTSKRVSAGFLSRAQRGLWNGGVLPLGYEPDPDKKGSLRIIEKEAKTVQSAFQALLAHGATTKVPYYGHSSQIKREQTLDEKSHRCNPFRVPGRKLEEHVWKEILSLMERPSHREPLFTAIRKLSESRPAEKESQRKEIELVTTEGMLTNLAKRVAELPAPG